MELLPSLTTDHLWVANSYFPYAIRALRFSVGIRQGQDIYFRIGRDATRVSDEPTIPNLWRLEEYITPEKLVIQLFEENLVIRTDNEDSFQGPLPELADAI